MQEPNLNCQRDEYPPAGFWQDQDIHSQYIRMVPKNQNGPAGKALFALGFCRYNNVNGKPPASTRNARFDRIIRGPNRYTSIFTADVTTTLSTVSIQFDAYPGDPDFGLTANPCWPSTLVDDPGFALLNSDPWYFGYDERLQTVDIYSNLPPLAVTQNKPPRAGYQKRFLDPLDTKLALHEGNGTQKLTEECLAELGIHQCHSSNCVDELKKMNLSSVYGGPPKVHSLPRASEAEPTAADSNSAPAVTLTAAMVGGGAQSVLNSIPKPTGGFE